MRDLAEFVHALCFVDLDGHAAALEPNRRRRPIKQWNNDNDRGAGLLLVDRTR